MKVLQIRGINCSGKTLACTQYVREHAPAEVVDVYAYDKYVPVTVTTDAILIGNYATARGMKGDYIAKKARIFAALSEIMDRWPDRDIVFENFIFGKSFKFICELAEFCRERGCDYDTVWFYLPYEEVRRRAIARNGNDQRNWNGVRASIRSLEIVHAKMMDAGIHSRFVDTRNVSLGDMYTLIEDGLR